MISLFSPQLLLILCLSKLYNARENFTDSDTIYVIRLLYRTVADFATLFLVNCLFIFFILLFFI